jgi:hypothetical protein
MRRDLDLIRDILLAVGDQEIADSLSLQAILEKDQQLIDYNLDLLINEVAFLRGSRGGQMGVGDPTRPAGPDPRWKELRLTWPGNDFLDSVEDYKNWERFKKGIASGAKVATTEAIKEIVKKAAAASLATILLSGEDGTKGEVNVTITYAQPKGDSEDSE